MMAGFCTKNPDDEATDHRQIDWYGLVYGGENAVLCMSGEYPSRAIRGSVGIR